MPSEADIQTSLGVHQEPGTKPDSGGAQQPGVQVQCHAPVGVRIHGEPRQERTRGGGSVSYASLTMEAT